MRPDKPWFGPSPVSRNPFCPLSWQGWAVMAAFFLGMGLTNLEPDLTRRGLAAVLLIAAFCAVVILTWDSDAKARSWRDVLFNKHTLVWLALLLALAAAIAADAVWGCQACERNAPAWLHPMAPRHQP